MRHAILLLFIVSIFAFGCDRQPGESDLPINATDPQGETVDEPGDTDATDSSSDQEGKQRDTAAESSATQSKSTTNSTTASTSENEKPLDISFDQLIISMQPDVVFRPWMLTPEVQALDGKKIRLHGYMYGGVQKRTGLKEFILLRNTECKFGPGGQADHLIKVKLDPNLETSYTTNVVMIEGTLTINPYEGPDGNTWSIYDMQCNSVKERKW